MKKDLIKDQVSKLKVSSTLNINEESNKLEKQGKKIFRFGFGQSPFSIPHTIVNEFRKYSSKNKYLM